MTFDVSGSRVVVTGGAGFIGSHTVDALVAAGADVTVLDDLSTGSREFLAPSWDKIAFVEGDCGDAATLAKVLPGADSVWHLAADPDVRGSAAQAQSHFRTNVAATFQLVQAMARHDVGHLAFTSTSTVYGDASIRPTREDYGPLLPISLYGGSKLACEALIAGMAATHGFDALLFRFANVVGPRSNHGVTYDFVRKLRHDPSRLEILGDGSQTKSYVSVRDTVEAMLHAASHAPAGVHPFNIGSEDAIDVTGLAGVVAQAMGLEPELVYTGGAPGGGGWVGDVKHMSLDIGKLRELGWLPQDSSAEALRATAQWLAGQDLPPWGA